MGANNVRPASDVAASAPADIAAAVAAEEDIERQAVEGAAAEQQQERQEQQASGLRQQSSRRATSDDNYEALFYRYADEFNPPRRNVWQLCLRPEGVLAMQLLTAVGVSTGLAVSLLNFSRGHGVIVAMCFIVLALVWADVLRSAVLVGVRKGVLKPSIRCLQRMRVAMYLSGFAAGVTFVAFVFVGLGKADPRVLLTFFLLEVVYVVGFGWLHALVEFFTPRCFTSCREFMRPRPPRRGVPANVRKTPAVTQAEIDDAVPLVEYNEARFLEEGLRCDECSICILGFESGDAVRVLRCEHIFHQSCVDQWWLTDHTTCPSCRSEFRVARDEEGAEEEEVEQAEAPQSDGEEDAAQ